jgi:L-fucose isomerase-like protein
MARDLAEGREDRAARVGAAAPIAAEVYGTRVRLQVAGVDLEAVAEQELVVVQVEAAAEALGQEQEAVDPAEVVARVEELGLAAEEELGPAREQVKAEEREVVEEPLEVEERGAEVGVEALAQAVE